MCSNASLILINYSFIFICLDQTISTVSPIASVMTRTLRSVKTFKKSWDADKALRSTSRGNFGKYQFRAFIFLALGYAIIVGWVAGMPVFACKNFFLIRFLLSICIVLKPEYVNCTPIHLNASNIREDNPTSYRSTEMRLNSASNNNTRRDGQVRKIEMKYNYSQEYRRTVFTDVRIN